MTWGAGSSRNRSPRSSYFAPGYEAYLKSKEWRDFRELYYSVNLKICVICKSPGTQNLHHYDHQNYRSKNFSDFCSLCVPHHKAITAGYQKRRDRKQSLRLFTLEYIAIHRKG